MDKHPNMILTLSNSRSRSGLETLKVRHWLMSGLGILLRFTRGLKRPKTAAHIISAQGLCGHKTYINYKATG